MQHTHSTFRSRLLFLCAALLMTASQAHAQPYAVSWYTIDGGGAMFSTGGPYTVGGTIGQPDAGAPNTGGPYAMRGGFWLISVCPADFDGDGFISGTDFDLYVQAFEGGDPTADMDLDGFITGIDYDAFVQEFEAGCP